MPALPRPRSTRWSGTGGCVRYTWRLTHGPGADPEGRPHEARPEYRGEFARDADARATARQRLEAEKAALERQLAEHGAVIVGEGLEVAVSVDEGFADSAQATAERSELLAIVDQLRSAYGEVVHALERLDQGTYGKCERCGNDIPVDRLEALPTARLCMSCKQLLGV